MGFADIMTPGLVHSICSYIDIYMYTGSNSVGEGMRSCR